MQAIARVDDTYDQARRAVEAMEAAGFSGTQISLVANKNANPSTSASKSSNWNRVEAPANALKS
ncbi:hypothetical protein [Reyranella sp.]|uniref:hypothetical protein n=1 Tax=Reyranella sp. TaxID=1929291 RepID=UPI00378330BC